MHTYIHTYMYIYIYIFVLMYVCICIFKCIHIIVYTCVTGTETKQAGEAPVDARHRGDRALRWAVLRRHGPRHDTPRHMVAEQS